MSVRSSRAEEVHVRLFSHAHKNTCMALKWNRHNGNWLISASRDHFCKLFDIRNLKEEVQCFRGHKKEACSKLCPHAHVCLQIKTVKIKAASCSVPLYRFENRINVNKEEVTEERPDLRARSRNNTDHRQTWHFCCTDLSVCFSSRIINSGSFSIENHRSLANAASVRLFSIGMASHTRTVVFQRRLRRFDLLLARRVR